MIEQVTVSDIIWESTKEIFETMIFLPVEKPETSEIEISSTSLICTITFTGQIQGSFSILCSLEVVEKIARAMLMIEEDPLDDSEISDAFGELANMVIGGIKSRLSETFADFQISIPAVTMGMEIQPILNKGMERVDFAANADGQPMKMSMMFKKMD